MKSLFVVACLWQFYLKKKIVGRMLSVSVGLLWSIILQANFLDAILPPWSDACMGCFAFNNTYWCFRKEMHWGMFVEGEVSVCLIRRRECMFYQGLGGECQLTPVLWRPCGLAHLSLMTLDMLESRKMYLWYFIFLLINDPYKSSYTFSSLMV